MDGLKKNTPEDVESETNPDHYNGWGRIYGPDGTCVAKARRDFDGLPFADVSTQQFQLALVWLLLRLWMATDLL